MHALRTIWGHRRALAGGLAAVGTIMILVTIGLVIAGMAVVVTVLSLLGLGP